MSFQQRAINSLGPRTLKQQCYALWLTVPLERHFTGLLTARNAIRGSTINIFLTDLQNFSKFFMEMNFYFVFLKIDWNILYLMQFTILRNSTEHLISWDRLKLSILRYWLCLLLTFFIHSILLFFEKITPPKICKFCRQVAKVQTNKTAVPSLLVFV